jgi:hypothetical protein
MEGKSEAVRILSKSGKKISSHITETFSGMTIIRAFDKQVDYQKNVNELINKNLLAEFIDNSCHHYFQLRLLTFTNIMFVSTGALCINMRGVVGTALITIAFQYL